MAGDFIDPADRFLTDYGIESDGAVLVRPDGFIGWRATEAAVNPVSALAQGLLCMLGRVSQ